MTSERHVTDFRQLVELSYARLLWAKDAAGSVPIDYTIDEENEHFFDYYYILLEE